MAEERKKVDRKPVLKVQPKKRDEPISIPKQIVKVPEEPKTNEVKVPETKVKRAENKYVRIALNAKMEERKVFSEKVQKGELKLAYYTTENDIGYHYYLVIK